MKPYQIELGSSFTDTRGTITNIINSPFTAAAIITSKAGTVRSNHWHRQFTHFLYIIFGSLEYYERGLKEDGSKIEPVIFKAGELFYTASKRVHKVIFLEDSVLLSLGNEVRTHQTHENDLVREEF